MPPAGLTTSAMRFERHTRTRPIVCRASVMPCAAVAIGPRLLLRLLEASGLEWASAFYSHPYREMRRVPHFVKERWTLADDWAPWRTRGFGRKAPTVHRLEPKETDASTSKMNERTSSFVLDVSDLPCGKSRLAQAAFFRGTLAPFLRASERPIAIACLRLFTFPPLPPGPDRRVPRFFLRIALATLFPAAFPYRRLDFFLAGMCVSHCLEVRAGAEGCALQGTREWMTSTRSHVSAHSF